MDKMNFKIDESYLTETLIDLVRINSCNPSLTPGSPGEAQIGAYVARAMESCGLEVHTHELAPSRVNVVGILRGSRSGKARSLMWNAHMDTVGVGGMADPFSGDLRAGKVYGRGSQDMKGSLAAMLAAARALADARIELGGDLLLTAVADEEYASLGTTDIARRYHADAAIVTEPTDLALCRAHRGFIIYKVETYGRAAHGSRYKEGIDAIMRMGRFLGKLDELEADLRQRAPHELVGPPSLHAGLIKGGSEVSIYAALCELHVERRTIPGETLEGATRELQQIIDELARADPTFRARLEVQMWRSPLEIPADSSIVQALEATLTQRLGALPAHSGATFWTDAALLADAGIETAVVGPIGAGLHSAEEWVDVASVVDLAYILADTAVRFCA
jgi:acetylornithine deacetylase